MTKTIGIKKVKVTIDETQSFEVSTDETLLSSLTEAGITVDAECGGQGTCGKCRVKVLNGQVVDRQGHLVEAVDDGWYLACQGYPAEDLVIDVTSKAQVSSKGNISDRFLENVDLLPPVIKTLIKPVYPTLENNYSLQEMVRQAIGENILIDLNAMKQLAELAPGKLDEMTILRSSNQIMAIEAENTIASLYGVAFDLGSTTVAGMLVDLNSGKVIAAAAETNPQVVYGADVISRIKAARTEDGLNTLSSVVKKCFNDLVAKLCITAGISKSDIYWVTVAGNSTMTHLLMGVSPAYLTISPYVPVFNDCPKFPPSVIDLDINPDGRIQLLPNIASFVSADKMARLPDNIGKRFKTQDGQKEFVLVYAEESASGRDISISQGDIREIQLVKSSIFTGVEILMENLGIAFEDIEQVLIAGAFGNHLNLESALAIGLAPSTELDQIIPVGNAAGTGAIKALLSVCILERCHSIVRHAKFIELATHSKFQKKFIKNLSFPEGI